MDAAVFFCVREARQNKNGHATATLLEIRLTIDEDELSFAGSLSLSSHPGRGTTVSGCIPLLL
jgi:signal transduction histidine kinase